MAEKRPRPLRDLFPFRCPTCVAVGAALPGCAMMVERHRVWPPGPRGAQRLLGWALGIALSFGGTLPAWARSPEVCQLAWSKAVRSYLTKNRRAGPTGSVPTDMDSMEAAAQAWLSAFAPACELEAEGDARSARLEAAAIGAQILARLDPRGCMRFLEYYMQSTRPRDICRAAAGQDPRANLRDQLARTIPSRG